jgi:hypothetical protein
MQIAQESWASGTGWKTEVKRSSDFTPSLILVFGARSEMETGSAVRALAERYPGAPLFGCTTSGEIQQDKVCDSTVIATLVRFDTSRVRIAAEAIPSPDKSRDVGRRLGESLAGEELSHVLLLSDGLRINGSELVSGITETLPAGIGVTGGLAGDGDRFEKTLVLRDGKAESGIVSAVGFYGRSLTVGYGSMGGWDQFGPDRVVTKSDGNIVHELDGQPALELYKRYLGPHASELPASGLLFPLSIDRGDGVRVVRTIIGVNEAAGTLTFAGEVPENSKARLMKANFDRLIEGAGGAALRTAETARESRPELALLLSCVGRKLVLKQRVEEEIEGVRDILGPQVVLAGFYSYGEIAPFTPSTRCELHNQTMTITTFSEHAVA